MLLVLDIEFMRGALFVEQIHCYHHFGADIIVKLLVETKEDEVVVAVVVLFIFHLYFVFIHFAMICDKKYWIFFKHVTIVIPSNTNFP